MNLLNNRFNLNRKTHLKRISGYSLIEVIVALGMSLVLGLATTAVVAWSVNVSARTQANTVLNSQTAKVLSKFETSLRDADRILSASSTELVYLYQRFNKCELQTYAFSTSFGETILTHTVRAATLSAGNYCSNIETALQAGNVGTQTSIVEGRNLDPASAFTYFSADAQRTYVTGEAQYNATTVTPLCLIGSVTMTIVNKNQTLNNGTSLRTETVTAGIRTNQFGISC